MSSIPPIPSSALYLSEIENPEMETASDESLETDSVVATEDVTHARAPSSTLKWVSAAAVVAILSTYYLTRNGGAGTPNLPTTPISPVDASLNPFDASSNPWAGLTSEEVSKLVGEAIGKMNGGKGPNIGCTIS